MRSGDAGTPQGASGPQEEARPGDEARARDLIREAMLASEIPAKSIATYTLLWGSIAQALADERERAAQIAERHRRDCDSEPAYVCGLGAQIAAAIREGRDAT